MCFCGDYSPAALPYAALSPTLPESKYPVPSSGSNWHFSCSAVCPVVSSLVYRLNADWVIQASWCYRLIVKLIN